MIESDQPTVRGEPLSHRSIGLTPTLARSPIIYMVGMAENSFESLRFLETEALSTVWLKCCRFALVSEPRLK